MEPAHLHYPWRQLGDLLVDEGLLTEDELEQALLEQARSGRLLGQIVVSHGYVSAFSLARVLSEQHGVHVRQPDDGQATATVALALAEPPEFGATEKVTDAPWRPLGKLLLERGFLTEPQLNDALSEQREGHGRLGEILVSRGLLSGTQLAQALAEQHGVELDSPGQELETEVGRPTRSTSPPSVHAVGA